MQGLQLLALSLEDNMETTKLCKCCNTTKEINQFNKNKSKKDGLSSECKECIKIYKKEYRLKNVEKIKAGKKKYYEANKEKWQYQMECLLWK